MKYFFFLLTVALSSSLSFGAALIGSDDFESNSLSGGTGWTSDWISTGSGGTYLETTGEEIDGSYSLGIFGNGGETWVRREHNHQEGSATLSKYYDYSWRMKSHASFDIVNDGDGGVQSRMGLTIRGGNDTGNPFAGEIFSVFFQEGTSNLQYFDGTSVQNTSEVTYAPGDIYDVRVQLRPRLGTWTLNVKNFGPDGQGSPDEGLLLNGTYTANQDMNSVVFLMRGPVGLDQDVFLDSVTILRNVPEPGTVGFLGLGFLILRGVRARRKAWTPTED